ncbi:BppU family phage baseplate upper protein [Enterococcus avium]|uniref:BppU family phage baseplate upper protein n=2 Tax=Enterococcus avium TaxID=33945 RepID=UPI003DA5416A
MAYFKIVRKTLEINGSSRSTSIDLRAEVFSYDKNVSKFLFELTSKEAEIDLTGATVRVLLTYVGNDGKKGIIEDNGGVEANTINQIYYLLPEELRGYDGTVVMGLYVDLPSGEAIDIQNVQFRMFKSSIDDGAGVAGVIYFKSFEEWLFQVKEKALLEIQNIDEESERITKYADTKIKEYDEKFVQSNQKMSELQQSQIELSDQLDETNKKIDEADVYRKDEVFNKPESSANVIDQIGGAESTILKKELLVNGTEGMASRFVKDLPYTNIILNGDFKNGITNWSYHQPAGNLSEFVDDVVHAKSNNGTVTGVFQPSDQRLKYGYSTKANEKFFFYALAKGTGTIQLGFDKKRGSATLTQNYTWVGVESTGTTDNEVMTFYTTGEMWIKAIIVSKTEIMNIESFYPAAEDVGVVHGQPNLRNGTSSTLSEVTFIQTQYKETNLVVSNLFKPNDLVTYAVQIDNTAGTADVFAQLACKKSDNTYVSFNGSSVLKGSIGRSMVQVTVLEEYTNIYVKPLVKSNSTISTTVRYGEEKLINGSLEAMDEWTPSQADSGLTPINGGMVPFNEKDYEDLLSDDGIVRAETKIVGRGAEIETPFKIIEVFANRYPDIFGKTTTDAEKITRFKSIQKGVTIKSTLRGSGANASKNGQLYLKYTDGTSEFLVNNQTSEFVEISKTLTATQLDQLSSTGVLTVYATTKRNGTNDAGAISDGVTSALLEVKDLRLIVEIEANGKTIIESIIAANQVESIATGEEAEAGESNSVFMTPNLVFKAIAKWVQGKFVSTAGNETILGTKNFQDGIQVKGKLPVLTKSVNDYASVDKNNNASVISDGSMRLYRRGDIVYLTGSFKLSAAKYNQAVWFNVPSWAAPIDRPRMYWSSGSNFYLLAFDPSTINNIICIDNVAQDTWLTGSFCWLARDPY